MSTTLTLILLSVVALLTAALSAVAGIGGGTILIAAMYAVGLPPLVALALHAAVQAVSNGARLWAYRAQADWRHGLGCALVAAPLPFLVTPWLVGLNPDHLRVLLGGFVLVSVLPQPRRIEGLGLLPRMGLAGLLQGTLGPLVGASGLLLAPFFHSPLWTKEQTVATLALVQAIGHVIKLLSYASAGVALGSSAPWLLPLGSAVLLGTWLGRRIMLRISAQTFRLIFRIVLAVLGGQLLISPWL